jgi:TonB family protein
MTLVIDAAVAATVLLAAAWVGTSFMRRRSADLRCAVWRAAFTAVMFSPLAAAVPDSATTTTWFVAGALPDARAAVAASPSAASWLFVVWAAGALVIALRTAASLIAVRGCSRHATEVGGLRYSDELTVPCTWGVWRPEILLPSAARTWTDRSRDLVIRHETAHVARHDWAWQMAARFVVAVLWFHPLPWVAFGAMRREAEHATDDAVIGAGADAADYADELVRVARLWPAAVIAGVAMAQPSGLEARVRRLFDDRLRRTPASRLAIVAVVAVAALASASVAAARQGPVYSVETEGLEPPRVLKEVRPAYSPEAMKAGVEGAVHLQAIVNQDGSPSDIKVIKTLEPSLDRAAVDALLQWRFTPATLDGTPVRVHIHVEINFRLK